MATWSNGRNDDGLLVRFGTDLATVGGGGEFHWAGPYVQHEFDIDFSKLPAFGTIAPLDYVVRIQNGAQIVSAIIEVEVPFTSAGAPTLDIGLVDRTATSTDSYDIDGFVAATSLTSLNAVGKTVVGAGALVGTVLANASNMKSLVAVRVNVANYTAGRAKFRLNYFIPTPYVNPAP